MQTALVLILPLGVKDDLWSLQERRRDWQLIFSLITTIELLPMELSMSIMKWISSIFSESTNWDKQWLHSSMSMRLEDIAPEIVFIYDRIGLTVQLSWNLTEIAFVKHIWLQKWEDPTLAWNASDFEGMTKTWLPIENIWIPDIIIFNM